MLSIATRAGAIAAAIILAGSMLVWGVDLGGRISGRAPAAAPPQRDLAGQVAALQAELARMQAERAQLVASSENSVANAAIRQRDTIQIKVLQVENGKLVEDLNDFARSLPAAPAIRRAEAELNPPGALHYRLLLTEGAHPVPGEQVQLLVAGEQAGKPVLLPFPAQEPGDAAATGPLRRFEGTLAVPEGVTVRTISARLLQNGRVRIQQAVTVRSANHVRS